MEEFTRFLATGSIRILEGILAFVILSSALTVILAVVEDLGELCNKEVAGIAGAE